MEDANNPDPSNTKVPHTIDLTLHEEDSTEPHQLEMEPSPEIIQTTLRLMKLLPAEPTEEEKTNIKEKNEDNDDNLLAVNNNADSTARLENEEQTTHEKVHPRIMEVTKEVGQVLVDMMLQ